jgi:outer membrane protein, heavy metal efflux system
MRLPLLFIACPAALLLAGCYQTYHPEPLGSEAVKRALTPPAAEVLRVQSRQLRHPILKPVEIDQRDGLSPDEAAVLAVLVNPGLRAVRDERGLAEAQLLEAGLLPDPQVAFSEDYPTGGATAGTLNGYLAEFSLDLQDLITRSARKRAAVKQKAAVDLDIAWEEWQVAQAARSAVYGMLLFEEKSGLAEEMDRRLMDNLSLVRSAVDRGYMTGLDLAAAEAAGSQNHAALLELRNETEQQRLLLNRLLGLPPETRFKLQSGAETDTLFAAPEAGSLLDGLEERRLDLLALHRGYESQEASVRAAVLAQFPPISIGVNKARDTGNVISAGFGLSISLPIFNRNQARIALERATRKKLYDEYMSRVFEARSDIAQLLALGASLDSQVRTALEAVPGLEKLVDTYRLALGGGQADILSYYTAWNSLTEKRIEVLSLRQSLAETRIALEVASGLYRLVPQNPAPAGSAPKPEKEN